MAKAATARHMVKRKRRGGRVGGVVALLLAALFLAGAVVVHSDRLHFEPVLSGSMRPGIQPGDLAIVRPGPVGSIRVGEVIAYLPPGQTTPVMHRIVELEGRKVLTRGDANSVADPWGMVSLPGPTVDHLVAVVPRAGWILEVRRQLLIGIGLALLVLLLAIGILSSRKPRTAGEAEELRLDEDPAERPETSPIGTGRDGLRPATETGSQSPQSGDNDKMKVKG